MTTLLGNKYGRLLVVACEGKHGRMLVCQCECGRIRTLEANRILSGHVRSCGNHGGKFVPRHGESGDKKATQEYRTWKSMHSRCHNPKAAGFENYGGKGVKVCERWYTYELFIADMGRAPSRTHTIERNDLGGDYSPTNCRWATKAEQSRNRSCAYLRSWELAEKLGVSVASAYQSIRAVMRKNKGLPAHVSPAREAAAREHLAKLEAAKMALVMAVQGRMGDDDG